MARRNAIRSACVSDSPRKFCTKIASRNHPVIENKSAKNLLNLVFLDPILCWRISLALITESLMISGSHNTRLNELSHLFLLDCWVASSTFFAHNILFCKFGGRTSWTVSAPLMALATAPKDSRSPVWTFAPRNCKAWAARREFVLCNQAEAAV